MPRPGSFPMVCYRHNRDLSVAQCQTCGLGLCSDCARIFHPPTCRTCERVKAEAAVKPVIRRAIVALVLLGGSFFGIEYAINALLHATAGYSFLFAARNWTFARTRIIDMTLTYILAAWPYGLKDTSGIKLPQGYLVPVSWYFDVLQWRVFGGLLIGPFVFPIEVVRDFQTYQLMREIATFVQTPPPRPTDFPHAAPRIVNEHRQAKIIQNPRALNDDIIEQ
jgi:hypothetical protein